MEEKLVAICPGCATIKRPYQSIHFCWDCELGFEVATPKRVAQIKRSKRRREHYAEKKQD